MAAIYNFPKIYNWYLNKRLKWIEKYRSTTFIDTIKKYVSDGDVILDVACGTGNNCILLANNFPNSLIIGMDPNKAAIKYGQQLIDEAQIKNVRFIQGQRLDTRLGQGANQGLGDGIHAHGGHAEPHTQPAQLSGQFVDPGVVRYSSADQAQTLPVL